MVERREAILVAFGRMSFGSGVISAEKIFDELMRRNVWFMNQPSAKAVPGDTVFFYQNGAGLRGFARLDRQTMSSEQDRVLLAQLTFPMFPTKLELSEVKVFVKPVSLRPLVDDLSLISNKRFWGLSLRRTPRVLQTEDVSRIRKYVSRHRVRNVSK